MAALRFLCFLVVLLYGGSAFLFAQEAVEDSSASRSDAPKVFLDCGFCDQNYYRQQVKYINFVRDRRLADVYIMVTNIPTGGGGVEYSLFANGQGNYTSPVDTFKVSMPPNASNSDTRDAILKEIKLATLPYVLKSPLATYLSYNVDLPEEKADVGKVKDKWNFWTFNLNSNVWSDGFEYNNNFNLNNFFSANRTTEKNKFETGYWQYIGRQKFKVGDEVIRSKRDNFGFYSFDAVSLTPHWSAGYFGTFYSSVVTNQKASTTIMPALEYNVFDYKEATRKQFTFLYRIGGKYQDFYETTIYDKNNQWLGLHSLVITYNQIEKWGSFKVNTGATHYLNKPDMYNITVSPQINLNLFKGFNLYLSGRFSIINDQIYLAKNQVSESDVLLQQKQLATSYSYVTNFGFSYTFGSIYNNVVNNRFTLDSNYW